MQGQANHFNKFAPEKIPYAINRYITETKRLYETLQTQLTKNGTGYLVGDHVTIADIANYGWVHFAGFTGIELSEFPVLQEWHERLEKREAFQKGQVVGK